MKTFLDMDILEFPFGWKKLYEDALLHYPNGKDCTEAYIDPSNDVHLDSYHTDPVAFHSTLIDQYRLHRLRALDLVRQYHASNDHKLIGRILREDMMLYTLAVAWCYPEDDYKHIDYPSYNPERFPEDGEWTFPSFGYFAKHTVDPWRMLQEYRIVDFRLDSPGAKH